MKRLVSLLGFALCGGLAAFSNPVYTNPGTVAPAYTYTAQNTGDLVGYFYSSTAWDTDLLGVFDNGVQLGSWALDNQTSKKGDSFDFGHVNAGDTLVFALQDTTQGTTVYSDPSLNADNTNHTYTGVYHGTPKIPAGTFVGFEDLLAPYADWNYNDEDVVFANIAATPGDPSDPTATPEPSTIALLGMGLVGTAFGLKRKKRA